MKIKEPVNRVEIEQKLWDEREARFINTFNAYPNAINSRAFRIEKLEYYEEIQTKYRYSPDKDERLAARFLKEQANKLERELYPSSTVRFLRSVLNSLTRELNSPTGIKLEPAMAPVQNNQAWKAQLVKAGFGSFLKDVDQQVKQGADEIKVSAPLYFKAGEKTDFTLALKKDDNGKLQFLGFQVSIPDQDHPGNNKVQRYYFEENRSITANQAYNQLNGRAIKVEYGTGAQKQANLVMLDFNDRDAVGNFRKMEFPFESFDAKKEIDILPLKGKGQPLTAKLEQSLMEGNREQVTFISGGKERTFFIEVNAQLRSIVITDDQNQKISLKAAIDLTEQKTQQPDHSLTKSVEVVAIKPDATKLVNDSPLKVVKGMDDKTTNKIDVKKSDEGNGLAAKKPKRSRVHV